MIARQTALTADGLMRMSHSSHAEVLELHSLVPKFNTETDHLLIDRRLYEVWYAGTRIALTATEYDLLNLLVREHDRVLSRSEIFKEVWGDGEHGLRVVDTYVSRLRTKLKAASHPGVISIRKRGYRLAGAVSQADN